MVTKGIVLGHKISAVGLKVDQAKVSIIKTILAPTTQRDKKFPRTCWFL